MLKKFPLNNPIVLVILFGSISFLIASLTYFIIKQFLPQPVFSWPYVPAYHWQYPYQYISIISIVYAILATIWTHYFHYSIKEKKYLSITILLVITILIGSILCGILWGIHDTIIYGPSIRYPLKKLFIKNILQGATGGFLVGWIVVLLSFPYNIIMFIWGIIITTKLSDFVSKRNISKK